VSHGHSRINSLKFLLIAGIIAFLAGSPEVSGEETFLWEAPESGSFILTPEAGWSTGNQMDGAIVGLRGLFVFQHFLGGLHGQAIFIESGAMYTFGLDFIGRYGPIYAGLGPSGHYFPTRTGAPTWGIGFQIGVNLPTPFEGVFIDLAYRPVILLSETQTGASHQFLVGVVFET
jgi:hypothetical protein